MRRRVKKRRPKAVNFKKDMFGRYECKECDGIIKLKTNHYFGRASRSSTYGKCKGCGAVQ